MVGEIDIMRRSSERGENKIESQNRSRISRLIEKALLAGAIVFNSGCSTLGPTLASIGDQMQFASNVVQLHGYEDSVEILQNTVESVKNYESLTEKDIPELKKTIIYQKIEKAAINGNINITRLAKYLLPMFLRSKKDDSILPTIKLDALKSKELHISIENEPKEESLQDLGISQKQFDDLVKDVYQQFSKITGVRVIDDGTKKDIKLSVLAITGAAYPRFEETEDPIFGRVINNIGDKIDFFPKALVSEAKKDNPHFEWQKVPYDIKYKILFNTFIHEIFHSYLFGNGHINYPSFMASANPYFAKIDENGNYTLKKFFEPPPLQTDPASLVAYSVFTAYHSEKQ